MKLATLRSGTADGRLVVVSRDLKRVTGASDIAGTLQEALDGWAESSVRLVERFQQLENGEIEGEWFDLALAHSPLPRAYQWCDGSTYVAHGRRMSEWRNLTFSESEFDEPIMYQGASDSFLAPNEDIPLIDETWGLDYEAEVAIITEQVPLGVSANVAASKIALVMLCNDISLRDLIPAELAKGFGFVQAKPSSSFSPVAVTPDELGDAWRGYRLGRPLRSYVNGELFGQPDAGQMAHGFDSLVSYAAKTRALGAGTIIGGGTVANEDHTLGASCLVERRIIEDQLHGETRTPFLKQGDKVKIEMLDDRDETIFGPIEQMVAAVSRRLDE